MQQVLQNIRGGRIEVARVPAPLAREGEVLIANVCSVLSAGTERMARELARKSLLGKARERPDHVRRVLEKLRSEGFFSTLRQVRERLDSPMPMGYSSAGVVLACGAGVQEFKPGDRVASNGPHAEIVCVSKHLCARTPENVPFEQAAFTVLGAIALQGVRLAEVSLGETVFVIGLGLVGQLAVALLKAMGCRAIGTDPDAAKCQLAMTMGADLARPNLPAAEVEQLTGGLGADAVVIAASTQSNGPIDLAAKAVRKKGRVVLVGVVGLELDRRPFYFKEAEFVVSCSYGPGRYDPEYEERGRDYPAAYVRWTEQRNMQAFLDLLAAKRVDVAPLISHRFPIAQAAAAYDLIERNEEPYLGILLEYDAQAQPPERRIELRAPQPKKGAVGVGVLGAGSFARSVLLPALGELPNVRLAAICSAGGVSAAHVGRKLGFESVAAEEDELFADPAVEAVFSVTRHDQHARHVLKAIRAGKPIFIEKPLCRTLEELEAIEDALQEAGRSAPLVMVGFNRRFAPAAVQVREFFAQVHAPLTVSIRFNAGAVPAGEWIQQEEIGGGRIVGEACHGIDLAAFLAGSPPVRVYAESIGGPHAPEITEDQCFLTLRHANGSVSSIAYLAGGDRGLPKERIEVFGGGRAAVIDDFRRVVTSQGGKARTRKFRRQDKGHRAELAAFARALTQGGPPPIAWQDLRAVMLASLLAVPSLREGTPLWLSPSFNP